MAISDSEVCPNGCVAIIRFIFMVFAVLKRAIASFGETCPDAIAMSAVAINSKISITSFLSLPSESIRFICD